MRLRCRLGIHEWGPWDYGRFVKRTRPAIYGIAAGEWSEWQQIGTRECRCCGRRVHDR